MFLREERPESEQQSLTFCMLNESLAHARYTPLVIAYNRTVAVRGSLLAQSMVQRRGTNPSQLER